MITPAFNLTATERVLPKLALDFTTASLDSRITFTRALNTATRVNSSGLIESVNADVARFDYDPITLACKGLLIEESRSNSFLYSQDFNTYWTLSTATIGNDVTISPDGTQNADKLIPSNGIAGAYALQNQNYTSGTTYTISVYAKKAGFTELRILLQGAPFGGINRVGVFDLNAGTASQGNGTPIVGIANAGNGWYRCWVTMTATTTTTDATQFRIAFTGDGTSGVYIWGAQLEAGAFPTSYIPTTTTSLTRNADVATMTGTNFSSWYLQGPGTVAVEVDWIGSVITGFPSSFEITDGSSNNWIGLTSNSWLSARISIRTGGAGQVDQNAGAVNDPMKPNTVVKYNIGYSTNSTNGGANGTLNLNDTTCTIPVVMSQARIGSSVWLSSWNGHIRKIQYYPQRLINAELTATSK